MTIAVTGATGQLGRLVIGSLKRKVAASRSSRWRAPRTRPPISASPCAAPTTPTRHARRRARRRRYAAADLVERGSARGWPSTATSSPRPGGRRRPDRLYQHPARRRLADRARRRASRHRGGSRPPGCRSRCCATAGTSRTTPPRSRRAGRRRADRRRRRRPHLGRAARRLCRGRGGGARRRGHAERTYELAADQAFTLADLAAEIARQPAARSPTATSPSRLCRGARRLRPAGAGGAGLCRFDTDAAAGALLDDGRALSALIGRPTTPLAASVAAALTRSA